MGTVELSALSSIAEVGIGINLAVGLIRDLRDGLFLRKAEDVENTASRLTDQVKEAAGKLGVPLEPTSTMAPIKKIERDFKKHCSIVEQIFKWCAVLCALALATLLWFTPWCPYRPPALVATSTAMVLAIGPLATTSLFLYVYHKVTGRNLAAQERQITEVLQGLKVVPTTPVPPSEANDSTAPF